MATYRQWQALGAQVRKGEKGTAILFYKDLPQSRDADAEGPRFVARASSVFNAAQVEGVSDEAELGAAFVLARLGLASTPHPNHASYIAHCLPLLRADPRALVTAAAPASRAAAHLAGRQSQSKASTMSSVSASNTDQGAMP